MRNSKEEILRYFPRPWTVRTYVDLRYKTRPEHRILDITGRTLVAFEVVGGDCPSVELLTFFVQLVNKTEPN